MGKSRDKINIKYFCMGASKQVTGSCHLLKINVNGEQSNLVIDYGMVQDGLRNMNELYNTNKKNKIDWENIVGVILSHAHT